MGLTERESRLIANMARYIDAFGIAHMTTVFNNFLELIHDHGMPVVGAEMSDTLVSKLLLVPAVTDPPSDWRSMPVDVGLNRQIILKVAVQTEDAQLPSDEEWGERLDEHKQRLWHALSQLLQWLEDRRKEDET